MIIGYIGISVILSIFAGREVIFRTLEGCGQFIGSQMSSDGHCVTLDGIISAECEVCQSYGMLFLIPFLIVPFLLIACNKCCWVGRRHYEEAKQRLEVKHEEAEAETRVYPSVVTMHEDDAEDEDDDEAKDATEDAEDAAKDIK